MDNPEKILRLQAVMERCGLSRITLFNQMAVSEFPTSKALGAHSVGWLESEINARIAARINASRNDRRNKNSPGSRGSNHRGHAVLR
jgi:prophage regulatory protein